jgi:N-methylhydantoinase B/oxoprolinase/acetone carboxylase alpha subunit
MTTLVVNDREVESIIAQYGKEKVIEYIKTFTPKARVKHVDDLDSRLKALKIVNPDGGKKLEEAFDFLNKEFQELGSVDYKQARNEYLTNKYAL